jgi:hypothetical protein
VGEDFMKRAIGVLSCLSVAVIGAAVAFSPSSSVVAAPAASGSTAASAAPTSSSTQSVYLNRASSGVILAPSVDDVEAFCALVLACRDVPAFPPSPDFQGCVKNLLNQLAGPDALTASITIRDCGLSATSCSKLRQCLLKGADPKSCDGVALESNDIIGKCDLDGRAISCWRGKVQGVRNCGLADELCVAKGGKAECALQGACPATAKAEWTCAGQRMVKCENNKFLSIDCSVLNLGCVTDKNGKAACAPTKTATCNTTTTSCKGNDAIACVNGKEVKVDCGQQGYTCHDPTKSADERTAGLCEVPAAKDKCDPASYTASCDGSKIKYCGFGQVRTYECKSIGATKCVMDKGSGPRCTG